MIVKLTIATKPTELYGKVPACVVQTDRQATNTLDGEKLLVDWDVGMGNWTNECYLSTNKTIYETSIISISHGARTFMTLLGFQNFFSDLAWGRLRSVGLELSAWAKSIEPFGVSWITNGGILLFEVCLLNLNGVSKFETYMKEVGHLTWSGTKGGIVGWTISLGENLHINGLCRGAL